METTEEEKAKKWKKGGRLITLKFAGVCTDCGAELPAGIQARWYGRGRIYGRGCHSEQPQTEGTGAQDVATVPKREPSFHGKFREMAKNLDEKIEAFFADRLENTPKRMCQGAMARLSGVHLQRTQQALYALADLNEAGPVPDLLKGFLTKTAIHDAMRAEMDRENCGYYDAPQDTGKPATTTPEVLTLWALIEKQTEEEQKQEELHRKIKGLQFSNIPGYFPTPEPIIKMMVDYANIQPDHKVFDPSAGAGAILDIVKPLCKSAEGIEINQTLFEITEGKGHSVARHDFLNWNYMDENYDRVLMNPPFENLQDIDHVIRAFDHALKPGGRLVSIMSPGPFFHSTKKAQEFRQWFEDRGGEVIDLPPDSFKQSGTGVNSKLIILDKAE